MYRLGASIICNEAVVGSSPTGSTNVADADLLWLAGWLEGEGSFCAGPPAQPHVPSILATSTDKDVIDRAAAILGCRAYAYRRQREHHKQPYRLAKRGAGAVEWMMLLRPLMGERRRVQIDVAVASFAPPPANRGGSAITLDRVREIRRLAAAGAGTASIARALGVESSTVSRIKNRRTFADVE